MVAREGCWEGFRDWTLEVWWFRFCSDATRRIGWCSMEMTMEMDRASRSRPRPGWTQEFRRHIGNVYVLCFLKRPSVFA